MLSFIVYYFSVEDTIWYHCKNLWWCYKHCHCWSHWNIWSMYLIFKEIKSSYQPFFLKNICEFLTEFSAYINFIITINMISNKKYNEQTLFNKALYHNIQYRSITINSQWYNTVLMFYLLSYFWIIKVTTQIKSHTIKI